VWKNDFRRFLLKSSKFEDLKKSLCATYADSLPSSFSVKYEDDEGEQCTITSDVELVEALHICEKEKRPVLKVFLNAADVGGDSMEVDAESKDSKGSESKDSKGKDSKERVSKTPLTLQQFVETIGILVQDTQVQAALPVAVNAALASIETVSSLQELVKTGVNASSYLKNHVLVQEMLSQLASVPEETNQKFQHLKRNPMALSMIRMYLPQAIQNLPMLLPMLPMFLESLASGQGPFGGMGQGPFGGGMGFPFPHPHPSPHSPHHPPPHHGPFGPHHGGPHFNTHRGPFSPGPSHHHGPFTGPYDFPQSSPQKPENKEQVHTGVRCDGCDCEPIRGIRFKCSVCANYDLCQKCEAKNIHPEHSFLKIREAERSSETQSVSDMQSETSQSESPWGHHWGWWGRGGRRGGHGWRGGRGRFHSLFGSQSQDWRCGRGEKGEKARVRFVENVTIPERAVVLPGQTLIKTWRVENVGSSDWPENSKLIFLRGDRTMSTEEEFPVPVCKAGQSVEVSAVILTPTQPGRHTAVFRLADAERMPFGPRLWCDVVVPDPSGSSKDPLPTAPPTTDSMDTSSENKVTENKVSQPEPVQKPTEPIPQKFAIQLKALESMGFVDMELNKQLLEKYNGNVQTVCEQLLQHNLR